MKAYPYQSVESQAVPGCPGVTIRWLIGENVNAPNFITRVIEIGPGAATEYHTHDWEHEVYVLGGHGYVRDADGKVEVGLGSCVYVEPNEIHQFVNSGDEAFRFICVIPKPKA